MRRLVFAVLIVVALLALASPVNAKPVPTGSFTLTLQETTVTFVVSPVRYATRNDEHTLGVRCDPQYDWGRWEGNDAGHNPYVAEFNMFGDFAEPLVLTLPPGPRTCSAQLVIVDWFKGSPVAAWTLDTQWFSVSTS